MVKKILISVVIVLAAVTAIGLYGALKYRTQIREQRLTAKAPEISITFIGGWDNTQIANYLGQNNIISPSDFLAAQSSFDVSVYPLLSSKPASADLEGFLFPDTYFIAENSGSASVTAASILKKALDNFSEKITQQMQAQAQSDNMSLYQIITLASIIQKEAGPNQTDKQTIAGIFYNRLKANMPLQSDATVSFITGNSDVTAADTEIDSPYNTFKYPGLPAGPICNPDLNSIMAALYPISSDYLYFLTDPKTGQAIYAQTYQEHLANKAKYLGD